MFWFSLSSSCVLSFRLGFPLGFMCACCSFAVFDLVRGFSFWVFWLLFVQFAGCSLQKSKVSGKEGKFPLSCSELFLTKNFLLVGIVCLHCLEKIKIESVFDLNFSKIFLNNKINIFKFKL